MSVDCLSLRNFVRETIPLRTLIINVLTKYCFQYMVRNYISSFFSPGILLIQLKISNFFTWRDFWHLHFIKSTFRALNYYLSFWQNMKGHQKSKVKYITVGDIIQLYIVQGKIFWSYEFLIDGKLIKFTDSTVSIWWFFGSDCNSTILNCNDNYSDKRQDSLKSLANQIRWPKLKWKLTVCSTSLQSYFIYFHEKVE